MTKALTCIEYVEMGAYEEFFEEFKTSDYLTAIFLEEMIEELRLNVIKKMRDSGEKAAVNDFPKLMFFETEEELLEYCLVFGKVKLDKKHSKTKGC